MKKILIVLICITLSACLPKEKTTDETMICFHLATMYSMERRTKTSSEMKYSPLMQQLESAGCVD